MGDIQNPNGFESNETIDGVNDIMHIFQPGSGGTRRNKRIILDTLKVFFQTVISAVSGNIVTFSGSAAIQDSGVAVSDIGLNTTHRTSNDGSDHSFIDQDVKVAAGPTFNGGVQTDGTLLKTKVIAIGTWNMTSLAQKIVSHGLDITKIRSIDVLIINDAGTALYKFESFEITLSGTFLRHKVRASSSNIIMDITLDSVVEFFDDAEYSGSGNRGHIKIQYEV